MLCFRRPAVAGMIGDRIAGWPGRPHAVADPRGFARADFAAEKRAAFAVADVALAASGTVSLELAASQTPMVIAYDMSWLSRKLVLSMLKVDTVTLVNMVAESRTVPEFIGDKCRPGPIAAALNTLLDSDTARRDQLEAMALTMMRLGRAARRRAQGRALSPVSDLGAAQAVKSAFAAPLSRNSTSGAMAKTWRGVPAAAQTKSKSKSRGSNHARTGVR